MIKLQVTKFIERTQEELDKIVENRPDKYRYNNMESDLQYQEKYKFREDVLNIELTEEQYNVVKKSVLEVF